MAIEHETIGKHFYKSKTFWLNIIAIAGLVIQSQTGYVINPATQAIILSGINLILRKITKEPIGW